MYKSLYEQYSELYALYKKTNKLPILIDVEKAIFEHNYKLAYELMSKLENENDLLNKLQEKLKGKSVEKTLRKIDEGTLTNNYSVLKGLSSLFTHCMIECEHGNTEYAVIAEKLIYKIQSLIKK